MRLILLLFFLLPVLSHAQVYNVFEVKSQDTLEFKGNLIRLPAPRLANQVDYLVELEKECLVTKITLDIATDGIEIFGYAVKGDGQFHLLLTTNKNDQVYDVGHSLQYLLIRLGPGVWQTVNIDFTIGK